MSYRARRGWALVILLVGMPIYIVLALNLVVRLERLPIWAEVPLYILLGTVWILPLRRVFLGIGQADPDQKPDPDQ